MQRTFKHRVTIGAICGIILLLCLSLYFFWVKSAIAGVVAAVVVVLIAETVIDAEYTLTDDRLIINKGRLWRKKTIYYREITALHPMTSVFGLVRYLLISYNGNRIESVQPQNEAAFVEVLRKAVEKERERTVDEE